MTFVLRMAGRELRASWRRLVFFFVCVAVGVGAIVALRSLIQSVGIAMTEETRALTAADILITSGQPWSDEALTILDETLGAEPDLVRTSSIETATMARPADETKTIARVVELRGVEAAFPFYGDLVLQDDVPYHHRLLAGSGALVRPELLAQLDVVVGDQIVIGEGTFEIRGVILREPGGQLGAFSFGPRVLVDYDDLQSTGLLGFGTRVDRQLLIRVPEARIEPLVEQLREPLRDQFIRIRSYRSTEDRIAANMLRAENYLSLIGFVVVILGGIGVWSVTRVFVQQRVRSVAILKCLGATGGQVLAIYVLQVVALGFGGSVLGRGAGRRCTGGDSGLSGRPGGVGGRAGRPVLRVDGIRGGAGRRCRGRGVVAVRVGSVARDAGHQAARAAALGARHHRRPGPGPDRGRGGAHRRAHRTGELAGRVVGGRVLGVRRVCPRGGRVAPGGAGARSGDPTAWRRGAVCRASRRAQPGATRESDSGDSAGCRAGQLLYHRDPCGSRRTCSTPSRSRFATTPPTCFSSTSNRIRWTVVSALLARQGGQVPQFLPVLRARVTRRDGAEDDPGDCTGRATARRWTRVHGDLPGRARGERAGRGGGVLGAGGVRPGGGVGRRERA